MLETRRRVLVVEDDEMIRASLAEGLADDGYEVREAADGLEALAVLAEWEPNLILLDLMMPNMDGRAFRAEQRRLGRAPGVPVIILSAAHGLAEQGAALDAAAIIPKPFDLIALLNSVSEMIG